jgi:hypothetical protein
MTIVTPDPFEGAKWGDPAPGTPSGTITYSFAAQNLGDEPFHIAGGLDPSYQSDFRAALADWGAVANVHFQEVPDSAASDIRVGWQHIDGAYGTVADTYWNYAGGQMLHDWIGFDDSESYRQTANGHALGDGIDFSAIATHEIGHALGLAHNTADPAIMNPVMSVNELQPPDIAGIEAIYGAPQVASAAAPPTQATHLAAAAHADPLIALPPAGDPTFAGTLDHDIEVLASRPANADLHHLLAAFDHAAGGPALEHLVTSLPPELQHELQPALAGHHGDWFFAG